MKHVRESEMCVKCSVATRALIIISSICRHRFLRPYTHETRHLIKTLSALTRLQISALILLRNELAVILSVLATSSLPTKIFLSRKK